MQRFWCMPLRLGPNFFFISIAIFSNNICTGLRFALQNRICSPFVHISFFCTTSLLYTWSLNTIQRQTIQTTTKKFLRENEMPLSLSLFLSVSVSLVWRCFCFCLVVFCCLVISSTICLSIGFCYLEKE